ncbi:MAG: DUF1801 domain-containing protein [Gammaproteobacteria bacterium]
MMTKNNAVKITAAIRKIIFDIAPNANEKNMYGGLVYELDALASKKFCGIFAYANHVSVEFSRGAELADANNLLEGAGKFRRHLKIRGLAEIKAKQAENYIRQSFNLHC